MPHPLVDQLRFTRAEFLRSVYGVSESDAAQRILPMNCLAWNVGHLAWQEQRTFLYYGQGQGQTPLLRPDIDKEFAYGAPASTPSLAAMLAAWREVTAPAEAWLDTVTVATLEARVIGGQGKLLERRHGDFLQRIIYHYWYHTGENMAIRQQLGHSRLPTFVGDIDGQAPYRPEGSPGTERGADQRSGSKS